MAKDLVRTRRYVRKFMLMKANIQAVSLKIQTLKSQSTMAQAMRGVTRAMATMNRQLNMPQIQKILQVYYLFPNINNIHINNMIDISGKADHDM
jgi:charged multivesicular body protein 2A